MLSYVKNGQNLKKGITITLPLQKNFWLKNNDKTHELCGETQNSRNFFPTFLFFILLLNC